MKNNLKILGIGALTAIAASLCCITPVLALLAGTSGLASTFHWLDPFRPYLIGISLIILAFAWYQKLKPQKEMACECETKPLKKFIQGKMFLGLVSVFTLLMLAFPYYDQIFYPSQTDKETVSINLENTETVEFSIKGMTCVDCERPVNSNISKLSGILGVKVSYDNENAVVKFDHTQARVEDIEEAINATGYSVTSKKEI